MVSIRAAGDDDGPAVAAVFGAARAAMTYLPALHTPDEDVDFFSGLLGRAAVEVAAVDDRIVGFSAVAGGWLDHLYVEPAHQSRGIGSMLLARAKAAHPDGLTLWVFEPNAGAQALYGAAGFIELERTDGRGNDEGVPDIKMFWPGTAGRSDG
jgi:GNAT superfamily N-acetyltransferase